MQEKGRDGGSAAGSDRPTKEEIKRAHDLAMSSDVVLDMHQVSDRSDISLIRDLRDVGTGKIPHVYFGCCPEVWQGGEGSEDDRADPTDECKACDVLRRADDALKKLTDRSVNSDRWMVGDEDCPPVLKLLDEFREEMLGMIPVSFDEQRVVLDTKILKVREMVRDLVRGL